NARRVARSTPNAGRAPLPPPIPAQARQIAPRPAAEGYRWSVGPSEDYPQLDHAGDFSMPSMSRIDPATVQDFIDRLKRIEGQARGIQRMIEEGRECQQVLHQV